MRRYIGIIAILLLALVIGCQRDEQLEKYKKSTKNFKRVNSYVSLSPAATEILATFGQFELLKGRTSSCNYPVAVGNVPIVMPETKPDYEQIAKIKPDLIVYEPKLFSEADIAKLKELNIELFAMEATSIDQYIDMLHRLGSTIHCETNFSEYVDRIRSSIAKAGAKNQGKNISVAIIMPGEGAEHMIAGTKSFLADVVRVSGGKLVGPDAAKFVVLNAETLVSENPDVILVAGSADSVRKDPRLASIKAIKDGRVIESKQQDVILRAGSRVDKLIDAISGSL